MASPSSTAPINPNYLVTIIQQGGQPIYAYLPKDFTYDATSAWEAPFAQGLGGSMLSTTAAAFGLRLTTQALTAKLWRGGQDSVMTLDLEFFADSNTQKDVRNNVVALLKLATPGVKSGGLLSSPGPQLTPTGVISAVGEALSATGKLASAAAGGSNSTVGGIISSLTTGAASTLSSIASNLQSYLSTPNTGATMTDSSNQTLTYNAVVTANNTATGTTVPAAGSAQDTTIAIVKRNIDKKIAIKIGNYAFFDCIVITRVGKTVEHALDANGRPTHISVNIQFEPMFTIVQSDLDQIFI